jgi:hypothetical protein
MKRRIPSANGMWLASSACGVEAGADAADLGERHADAARIARVARRRVGEESRWRIYGRLIRREEEHAGSR